MTNRSSAEISECGLYRYTLYRRWDHRSSTMGLIMLNPSTAGDVVNDPTVCAAMKLGSRWGFGAMVICNLFAWRSPSTDDLREAFDLGIAVGVENDYHLRQMIGDVSQVVVGWGSWGARYMDRVKQVDHLIRHLNKVPKCIGVTETGHPKHLLMRFHTAQQKASVGLEPWVLP